MSNHCFPEPKSPPEWVWIILMAVTVSVMLASPPKFGPRPLPTQAMHDGIVYVMPSPSVAVSRGH